MESTLHRLKQYIEYKGLTVSSFEKAVGFSNGALAGQLKKNKTIGVDKLEYILKIHPELSANWLLTGNGEMLHDRKEKQISSTSDKNEVYPVRNLYENEKWTSATLIKEEVQKITRSSLGDKITTLKTFRELIAKLLKFVNEIDAPLAEHTEIDILDHLNAGKTRSEILQDVNAHLDILQIIHPLLEKLNHHLQDSILELKSYDKNNELDSTGEELLKHHLLEQEFEMVARLQDKVKVYRRYIV